MLKIKDKKDRRWDLVSLGEVLLRFDPSDERIHNSRSFRVWDGGGEYNVARNLAKVFRCRTAIATALADNALGRLAEDLIRQAGVDASEIIWREADGKGENTRNGIYFIERGFGLRPPSSCFDRANTAVSQLRAGEIEWRKILSEAAWLHTGGVFVGLSETTPDVAAEALQAARESGVIVSYDLNYRDSLWRDKGGREAANSLNRQLLKNADVVFGAFDFDSKLSNYEEGNFRRAAEKMLIEFPNLQVVVSTLREVKTASRHDFSAVCLTAEDELCKAQNFLDVDVLDRVGSGDAFAAGFIYGLLAGKGAGYAVECGAAHGALVMTTPGDNSMATLREVESLMRGETATAKR